MGTLNVLLGAGFSYDAGLPLGADLAEYFTRDNREKLLRFYSSEWSWVDGKSEAEIHNGKNNWDAISYSYILNELVVAYTHENSTFLNYEHFFQFVVDLADRRGHLDEIITNARRVFVGDFPDVPQNSNYFYPFSDRSHNQVIDIINYLISDLLHLKKPIGHLLENYSSFLRTIEKYPHVNIFTLNHDLLVEKLFDATGLKYHDGFSRQGEGVDLRYRENYQRCFTGELEGGRNLIKLHGSIDTFRYDHLTSVRPGVLSREPNFTYYKPDGYRAKHDVVRVNAKGEVLQDFHSDVVPKFITGTRKKDLIKNDPMYSWGMGKLEELLSLPSDLLICGYSFGDDHVNEVLKKTDKGQFGTVTNINPAGFKIIEENVVTNYKSLKELSTE